MVKRVVIITALTAWFYLCMCVIAFGQTLIYRSFQLNLTTAVASLSSNAISISGSTLTATNALPDSIGVGDVVQYDSSNVGSVNAAGFISGRTSDKIFTIKRFNGGTPASCTNDTDGSIFRAYTGIILMEDRTENTGIADVVENFDAGTTRNLVTANEQWSFAFYGGNAGGGVTFGGDWTTGTGSSVNYIRFYAPSLSSEVGVTQKHSGTFTVSQAVIGFNAVVFGITIQVGKSIVEDLQLWSAGSSGQYGLVYDGTISGAVHTIRNCVFQGFVGGVSTNGIRIVSTGGTYHVSNNIAYDWTSGSGFSNAATGSTAFYYNNTSVDNSDGFSCSGGTCTYKNNLAKGNTVGFSNAGVNSEFNASSDATAPGTNSRINQTFTFVNEAGNNFLLGALDAGAATFGKDLSADANSPITIDILDATRTVPWDIGAHEVSAGAGRRRWIVQSMVPIQFFFWLLVAFVALGIWRHFFVERWAWNKYFNDHLKHKSQGGWETKQHGTVKRNG